MDETTRQNQAAYDAGATGWQTYAPSNIRHQYLEKPAMEAALSDDLMGIKVLCIGAGSGEELDILVAHNPLSIIATDISSELLSFAKARHPSVEVHTMDMHALDFPNESFDLVYSSLTFHYTKDWDTLLAEVYRVLTAGGELLFSTHHPGYWSKRPTGSYVTTPRGMKLTEHTATLPGGVGITYYNLPNTDAIDEVVRHAGFTLKHAYAPNVQEVPTHTIPQPMQKKYENLVKTNQKTPLFYVVLASR